jgi:hypothetical protein
VHKVFFSWQSDTEPKVGLLLVREALDQAIQRLKLDLELDEATRNQPGSQILFEAIRQKIESCAIFVPDLTFIGQSYDGRKRLPNSNVLIEYGYALANLDEERILPVINLHFGDIDQLPFDLRHRSIKVKYRLSPSSTPEEQKEAIVDLLRQFEIELRLIFESGSLFRGLSPEAVRIAKHLSDSSETGWGGQGDYEVDEIAASLNMEANEVNKLLRQLEALGYVERLQIAGTDAPPAIPTDRLFWDFDHFFKGWNPRKDAKTVLETMLKDGRRGENCDKLAKELSWDVRRINPALRYIVWGQLVLASNETSYPIAVHYMRSNERTEAFIGGIVDPERLGRRGGF